MEVLLFDDPARTIDVPSCSDVLRLLAAELDQDVSAPERIEVRKATDLQYVARIYPGGGEDYEAVLMTFQSDT